MFAKLFSSITESSLWSEPKEVRLLFVTMLAKADQNGFVEASIPGLARVANLTIEETEAGLECLQSPDVYSKNPSNEGRRVLPVPGGFVLLNYEDYRSRRSNEERREYMREYMQNYRKKNAAGKQKKTSVNRSKPPLAQAETETETETETEDKASALVASRDDLPPYQLIASEFVAAFGGSIRVTDKRKKTIRTRWRDPWWRDNWQAALELGCTRPFLLGENDRGWRMDFDFFLKPDTVTKIMEGKYAGTPQRQLTSNELRERANAEAFASLVFEDDDPHS